MNKNATFPVKKKKNIQRKKNPAMEFLVWNPLTCFKFQSSLKANQSHLPKSVDFPTLTDHWSYSDKTGSVTSILRKTTQSLTREVSPRKKKRKSRQTNTKKQTKRNRASYLLPHAFMEDTIRHNIAQMTSTSKAYIPCLLVIIIKWCHMITWNRLQHRYGGR